MTLRTRVAALDAEGKSLAEILDDVQRPTVAELTALERASVPQTFDRATFDAMLRKGLAGVSLRTLRASGDVDIVAVPGASPVSQPHTYC
jgi:hypothetical protein